MTWSFAQRRYRALCRMLLWIYDVIYKQRCNPLCRVLLDSFISTQKLSVQKTLQRKFKRFVSYKRDFQELLLSALQGLVREQIRYEACSGAASAAEPIVSIPMK